MEKGSKRSYEKEEENIRNEKWNEMREKEVGNWNYSENNSQTLQRHKRLR